MSRMAPSKHGGGPGDSSVKSLWPAASGWSWIEDKTVGAGARELDLTASSLANGVRQARGDRTQSKTCTGR